jgi:hypothetical protein
MKPMIRPTSRLAAGHQPGVGADALNSIGSEPQFTEGGEEMVFGTAPRTGP